jgi:hypothetical protein
MFPSSSSSELFSNRDKHYWQRVVPHRQSNKSIPFVELLHLSQEFLVSICACFIPEIIEQLGHDFASFFYFFCYFFPKFGLENLE